MSPRDASPDFCWERLRGGIPSAPRLCPRTPVGMSSPRSGPPAARRVSRRVLSFLPAWRRAGPRSGRRPPPPRAGRSLKKFECSDGGALVGDLDGPWGLLATFQAGLGLRGVTGGDARRHLCRSPLRVPKRTMIRGDAGAFSLPWAPSDDQRRSMPPVDAYSPLSPDWPP